ncbi:MAG: protein kinase domain-containing protein [Bradymonadaceae bacterium]
MSQPSTMLQSGDLVAGKYRIIEEVGRGSYGVVFRATQLGIERDVALKTLLPQAVGTDEGHRFEREARLVSRLTHPHIITLFDYGEHEGVLYMVMEFVEGRSLGDLIHEEAPLSAAKVRGLIYQMLDALQYAHDQGVVHRDLKPENIWLIRSHSMQTDAEEMIKILDFGIAKVVHGQKEVSALDTLTQTGFALGTPQYMSPENITGDAVTHKADLYAVGLIIYEMLTGKPPFESSSPHTAMVSHLRDEPPPLPRELGHGAWQRAIDLCLQKQPDDRIESAREIRAILEADEKIVGPGSKKISTHGKPSSKPVWVALIAITIVIVLGLVLLWQGLQPEMHVVESEVTAAGTNPSEPQAEPDEVEFFFEAGAEEEFIAADLEFDSEADHGEEGGEENEDEATLAPEAELAPARRSSSPVPSPEEPVEVLDERISLQVSSIPENARVSIDGRPIGTTPLVHRVAPTEQGLRLSFSLIGYRDKQVSIVPDKDQNVEIRLERGRLQLTP